MKIYIFVQYRWDSRWIRSRALDSTIKILDYVRSLPHDAKIRIAAR